MSQFFSDYDEAIHYLNAIPMFQEVGNSASNFELDRFQKALHSVGDPQKQFKTIHVTGTNGKGSTCRLLSHVLINDGQRTGLYTSPHLIDYRERVQINGDWIPATGVVRFLNAYKQVIEKYHLTYFEISTALAFWWFADQNVDWAVIETGLGGRLDATNVINPEISVITSIGLDHSDILGDTIPEVAKEKAGIIKPKVPVAVGNLDEEALKVVAEFAEKNESELIQVEIPSVRYSKKSDGSATHFAKIKKQKWYFDNMRVPEIQLQNWAIVVCVIDNLSKQLRKKTSELLQKSWDNLKPDKVFRACLERIHPEFSWYFDGGHNQQAIESLLESVTRMIEIGDRDNDWPIFVISAMKDKVSEKSFGQFAPYPNLFYYELSQPRAAKLAALKTLLPQIQPFPDQFEAQQVWLRKMQDQLVIFVGSFYFYSTVRDFTTSLAST